jgi:hypothetical protein
MSYLRILLIVSFLLLILELGNIDNAAQSINLVSQFTNLIYQSDVTVKVVSTLFVPRIRILPGETSINCS